MVEKEDLDEFLHSETNEEFRYLDTSEQKPLTEDEILSIKWKMIPHQLKGEVENLIIRNYNGDRKAYFKEVDVYFSTFTIEDLVTANLTDKKIKVKELSIQKLANSTQSIARQLRTKRKNALWHAAALLRLMGKGNASYCSNTIFNEFKRTKVREQEFIKNSVIVGTDKKVISLAKATKTADQSKAEKINLLKTVEKIAESKGFSWCFITLTLEGEYHPNPTQGKNSYNGVSPKESAKMLNKKINNVRAYLKKLGLMPSTDYIGCATAEAHKDGCLHKHIMLFIGREHFETVRKAFLKHFPNLNEESFVFESEENMALPKMKSKDTYEQGKFKMTPSSYILKYVMKAVNHFDANLDIMAVTKENDEALHNAMLNNAFRSYNNIRGFSFFGIENCMTKFRFLARNYEALNLPIDVQALIIQNDLYSLLTLGHFDKISNKYMKKEENSVFVGCVYQGELFIKRFFKLVKKATEIKLDTEEKLFKTIHKEVKSEDMEGMARSAQIALENALEYHGLFYFLKSVLVNPNYSRETQNQPKPNPFTLVFNVDGTDFKIPGVMS